MLAKDLCVAAQRGEPFLHPCSGRLDEADHGDPRALRELEHRDHRLGMSLAERAAGERGVLREHGDHAPVDATAGAENTIAGPRLFPHAPGENLGAQEVERPRIAEDVEALHGTEPLIGSWDECQRHLASRHSTAL